MEQFYFIMDGLAITMYAGCVFMLLIDVHARGQILTRDRVSILRCSLPFFNQFGHVSFFAISSRSSEPTSNCKVGAVRIATTACLRDQLRFAGAKIIVEVRVANVSMIQDVLRVDIRFYNETCGNGVARCDYHGEHNYSVAIDAIIQLGSIAL